MNTLKFVLACLAMTFCAAPVVAAGQEHTHDHDGHKHHEKHEHGDHDKHGHDHAEGHLHGPEVQVGVNAQKLIGIKTVRVSERQLESSVDLCGRFALAPSARAVAVAPVVGTVALRVKAHQEVRRGDVLFTVSSSDLRMRAAEIAVLEKRLAGYAQSGAKNATLKAELDLRKAERIALVGTAAETNGVIAVLSEIDGSVTRLAAYDGSSVEKGGAVVELANPHDLCFRAKLPAGDRARLKNGLPVMIGGRKGTVKLDAFDSSEVYVAFADPDPSWRAGDFARGTCITEPGGKASLVVPSEAVVQIGVTPTVFVRAEGEDDHFVAFAVEVGRRADGWTEILNFPDDDAEVVVRGQYELKLALAAVSGNGAKKSAHFHADGTVHEDGD